MRRTRGVLVGLVLAGAVFTTAPAEAAPASEFAIAIVADEGPAPASGSTIAFYATLSSAGEPVPGVPVTLTAKPYGASSFAAVGNGITAADGSITIAARLTRTSQLRWTFAGDGTHAATTSDTYVRTVGSRVRGRAVDPTLSRHQAVIVNGRSFPAKPGYQVSLWRGWVPCFCVNSGSTRIAVGRVRSDGTFRLSGKFAHPGDKQLYLQVNSGGGTTTGYSPYIRIHVR